MADRTGQSPGTQPGSADRQQSVPMILTMGGVGLAAAILLVLTYQITLPHVTRNRLAYLERAVSQVLPDAARRDVYVIEGSKLVLTSDPNETGLRIFAGYDAADSLVGFVVETKGQGFQDVLRIIYGYKPSCACVVGMKVLESKETPGLGDKIEKDNDFKANFESLDVRLTPERDALVHAVELVKKGTKSQAWEVEGITGATISSKAIANMIDASAREVLPMIETLYAELSGDSDEIADGRSDIGSIFSSSDGAP